MSLRPRPTAPAPTAAAGPGRTRLQHVLDAGLRAQELREQAQPPPPQPPQVMDVGGKMSEGDKQWCIAIKTTIKKHEAEMEQAKATLTVEQSKTDKIQSFLDSAYKKGDVEQIQFLEGQLKKNRDAITEAKEALQKYTDLRDTASREMKRKGKDCINAKEARFGWR